MTIAYYPADILCKLEDGYVQELIIENQYIFQRLILDIYAQVNGKSGDFVLSEDHQSISLKTNAELITQIIPFELNKKELINKLYLELKNESVNEYNYQKTQELLSCISSYLYEIINDNENELIYDRPNDLSGIFKLFNVRINDENLDLTEKILEYMTAVQKLKGDKVFFFVNLRSYLTDRQAELFFKSVLLKKIKIICIENCEHTGLSIAKAMIVDKDMCII